MKDAGNIRKQLRKDQDTLISVGFCACAFGFWSMARGCLSLARGIFGANAWEDMRKLTGPEKGAAFVIMLFFLAFMLSFRLYVGLTARAEGQGKKKGRLYVVLAGILAAWSLLMVVLQLIGGGAREYDTLTNTAALLLDVTNFVTLTELVFAAVRVKKIQRDLERQG